MQNLQKMIWKQFLIRFPKLVLIQQKSLWERILTRLRRRQVRFDWRSGVLKKRRKLMVMEVLIFRYDSIDLLLGACFVGVPWWISNGSVSWEESGAQVTQELTEVTDPPLLGQNEKGNRSFWQSFPMSVFVIWPTFATEVASTFTFQLLL